MKKKCKTDLATITCQQWLSAFGISAVMPCQVHIAVCYLILMISALIMFFNVRCLQKRLIITASPCMGVLNIFGNSSIMILKLSISGAISGFDYFKTPKNYNGT